LRQHPGGQAVRKAESEFQRGRDVVGVPPIVDTSDESPGGSRKPGQVQGENQSPKLIQGVASRNGVEVTDTPEQTAT
jgi:hypothetical protein